jgi:KDO2-lipid IV(A) lauroyltransferase
VVRLRGGLVDENLRYAFPNMGAEERRRTARDMWEHLFLLVLEVAHSHRKIHETNWRQYVTLVNDGPLLRQTLSDRPTILLSAHFGNFEVAGYVLGLMGFHTYAVARPLDNPFLNRFITRVRGATGQFIIPKNDAYEQLLWAADKGKTLAFLADHYAGSKGCWVEFFGRPASAHKAIALFALEHGAPMVVSYARRTDRPLHFEMRAVAFHDPRSHSAQIASIRELTQWYTTRFEEIVRTAPEQYWWLHRRWKDTRSKDRAHRRRAAAAA